MADKKQEEIERTSANEVAQNIRRTLTIQKIDPNACKYSVAAGTITLSGHVKFMGKQVKPEEMPRELKRLEDKLREIKGVNRVRIELETFQKNDTGDYVMSGRYKAELMRAERDRKEKVLKGGEKKVSKYAPVCANKKCKQAINFCPHCGEPLDMKEMQKSMNKEEGGATSTGDAFLDNMSAKKKSDDSWDMSSLQKDYEKQQAEEDKSQGEKKALDEAGKIKGAMEYKPGGSTSAGTITGGGETDDPKNKILEALRKKKEQEFTTKKQKQDTDLGSINWDKIPSKKDD